MMKTPAVTKPNTITASMIVEMSSARNICLFVKPMTSLLRTVPSANSVPMPKAAEAASRYIASR